MSKTDGVVTPPPWKMQSVVETHRQQTHTQAVADCGRYRVL